jgi:PHD/YefM family antitoxin component YafN of YafNO toxin-antitoxin module
VVDNREEVVITRAGHEPVVIVSLDDYESLKETAYLLRSPENARRCVRRSIDSSEAQGRRTSSSSEARLGQARLPGVLVATHHRRASSGPQDHR